ncbi:MAG: SLBB domain-containing protein [Pseudomonadota bacterium]
MTRISTCRLPFAVLLVAVAVATTQAQVPTPTPEQLEMLRSLPADQQQALLEEFGLPAGTSAAQSAPTFPELVRQPVADGVGPDDSPAEIRIVGGETLVISFDASALEAEAASDLESRPAIAALDGTRTWELTDAGELVLPGVATISLSGLSANDITMRLGAEPALAAYRITAQILPLAPTGVDALEYFGYDLFAGVPTSFAPATDVPVPTDYVMGPGDQLRIEYFGKENRTINAAVTRDGTVILPEIGPVTLAGLTFDDARDEIVNRIAEQKIGVRASVTMGELRSIRIFVLGDVNRPGSYTVSGLSTMTNALFLSGGVNATGSLRDVQLKRNGTLIGRLDLYDLLLRGDTRDDRRLSPGDVIFVPPVGVRVGVEGEVIRPAYYELRGRTTAGQLVGLAGGLRPTAFGPTGRIERVASSGDRRIIDADLSSESGRNVLVRDGDVLRIFPVLDRLDDSVELVGHVRRPAQYEWREELRVTDLIPSPALLKPQADTSYLVIRRETGDDGRIDVLSTDLLSALSDPAASSNPLLQPRDQVIVFGVGPARGARLEAILEQLREQGTRGDVFRMVSVGGQVRAPGDYPLEAEMRISDLLRAGGGFTDAAFLGDAELTRYIIGEDGSRQTRLIAIDLQAILAGDRFADEVLQPYDYLNIREIPEWRGQETVTLQGEVRFPGTYPIKRGETLVSVIERAGGLTDLSFADGSVFTREILKRREEEQIDVLVSRLEADLAALALQGAQLSADAQQAFAFGQSLLSQLRGSQATGRLVIDLSDVLKGGVGSSEDIVLKDGDQLLIPQQTQEVTVIGEVQYATSHLFDPELDRDDYISRSGGLTVKADDRRIYVVRANGQVVAGTTTAWLRRVGGTEIRAGDTIVVPIDADRIAPLTLWSSVTQIVYNLAVAVAAVNSF